MMQSYNRIVLFILLVLLILLWASLSEVYSRSEYSVSTELCGQPHTGEGLAVKTDGCKRPYVLLIGIETLRADHVGHLGYSRNTTPALDAIAKEGVIFTKTMATASWTMPAVMSVLTSLYPGVHGTSNYDKKLPESVPTLTEVLQENGYKTVAFVSNPTLDGRYGFCRGFELYDDFSVWLGSIGMGKSLTGSDSDVHKTQTNESLTRLALSWLERHYQEPFFMFAFYFDPHYDYIPPSPFDTMFDPNYDGTIDGRGIAEEPRKSNRPAQRDLDHIIALYDGEVRCTDTYISKLLEAFAEFGILDQTLVVIFGDHGDEFYEHGSTAHAHTLYNELIHVPLILRWPSEIPKGRCIDALVSQVDIMPTILDYLEIQHQQAIQGRSLKDLIKGRVDEAHEYVFAGDSTHRCAVIGSRNKMVVNPDGNKELYDLLSDPMEQNSIYQMRRSSALAASYERRLEQWALENRKLTALFPRDSDSEQIQLDEHRLKQLRALGYVQ